MKDYIEKFLKYKNFELHDYQSEAINTLDRYDGIMITAPTGSGKTYAAWIAVLERMSRKQGQLKVIWMTPLKALCKDIYKSLSKSADDMGLDIEIGIWTGDTSSYRKKKIRSNKPDVIITTPESIHVLLSYSEREKFFKHVEYIIVDEWHQLLKSKRGLLVQLGISYLKQITKPKIIGLSATLRNLNQASEILIGKNYKIINSNIQKQLYIETVYPKNMEKMSWAGHLGIQLADRVVPIINSHKSSIIFCNTRKQTELWYKKLIEIDATLIGKIALHHGSLVKGKRDWVEKNLSNGKLKCVVATSSLDLGIDFKPVEAVIQIGSTKSVSRFIQRAGRAGHAPGEKSKVYVVPTSNIDLFDIAAIRDAIIEFNIEEISIPEVSYDVLMQFITTLATGGGIDKDIAYRIAKKAYSYRNLTRDTFEWIIENLETGGDSLKAYDNYRKIIKKDGTYKIADRKKALLHRMSIGTIVSEPMIQVVYRNGSRIGLIEEGFVSKMRPGSVFTFSGRNLKYRKLDGEKLYVSKSNKKQDLTAVWYGSRIQLSSNLASHIRKIVHTYENYKERFLEIQKLENVIKLQRSRSDMPDENYNLFEYINTYEGYAMYLYPILGRDMNEAIATILGYRLTQEKSITVSIAYNDYGLEILSDQDFLQSDSILDILLNPKNLKTEIYKSINFSELKKKKFREISQISGLLYKNNKGTKVSHKYLQSSANLLFDVFEKYEPENLLFQQADSEVKNQFMRGNKLDDIFIDLYEKKRVINRIKEPSPFSFPIMVDRLRQQMSSEKLEKRIRKYIQ